MELIKEIKSLRERTTEKEHFWEEHTRRQRESGLTGHGYCKKHRLSYSQFIYWSDKKAQQEKTEVTELLPVYIKELPKSITKQQPDTLCTLVFNKGHELKIHDQSLLPILLPLLS